MTAESFQKLIKKRSEKISSTAPTQAKVMREIASMIDDTLFQDILDLKKTLKHENEILQATKKSLELEIKEKEAYINTLNQTVDDCNKQYEAVKKITILLDDKRASNAYNLILALVELYKHHGLSAEKALEEANYLAYGYLDGRHSPNYTPANTPTPISPFKLESKETEISI